MWIVYEKIKYFRIELNINYNESKIITKLVNFRSSIIYAFLRYNA